MNTPSAAAADPGEGSLVTRVAREWDTAVEIPEVVHDPSAQRVGTRGQYQLEQLSANVVMGKRILRYIRLCKTLEDRHVPITLRNDGSGHKVQLLHLLHNELPRIESLPVYSTFGEHAAEFTMRLVHTGIDYFGETRGREIPVLSEQDLIHMKDRIFPSLHGSVGRPGASGGQNDPTHGGQLSTLSGKRS